MIRENANKGSRIMNKLRRFFNSEINLNFYIHNPTRKEYLHNKAERLFAKTKTSTNRNRIKNSLKVLSNNDFVIFSSAKNKKKFIQYRKDRCFLIFDYSYSSLGERSK